MAVKYPAAISHDEISISSTISALRNAGFKEEHRIKLLRKFPELLDLRKSQFRDRIGFLNTYFENSGESLKAVLNSVEALSEAENVVKRKLRYLIFDMAHATSSIKNCSVLSFPLQFTKIRHEFLVRAGLYFPVPYRKLIKVREKEKASKLPRPKYFKPDDIVCTTDAQFLRTCTHGAFTKNDLAAFEEIYLAQQEDNEDDDDDDVLTGDIVDTGSVDEDDDDEDNPGRVVHSTGFGNKAETEQFYF